MKLTKKEQQQIIAQQNAVSPSLKELVLRSKRLNCISYPAWNNQGLRKIAIDSKDSHLRLSVDLLEKVNEIIDRLNV